MSENRRLDSNDFLFADVESRENTEIRIGKPFPPTITEYVPNDSEKEWTEKPIAKQLETTLSELKTKSLKKDDQVFLMIGYKVSLAGPNIVQVLNRFKGDLISHYDNRPLA